MNAYQEAQRHNLTGEPAAIVAALRAFSQSNIDAAKARLWLQDRGLLTYDGTAWFGSLETALPSLAPELQAGIRDLKARVLMGQPIRTAEPVHSLRVLGLINGITQAVSGTDDLVDSFYALDGGRPFKDLTVEQYLTDKASFMQAEAERLAAIELETAAQQAAAIRSARVASIESIDAAAIVDGSANIDAAASAIRLHLLAFGGW